MSTEGDDVDKDDSLGAGVGSFVLARVARPLPHPKRFGLADAGDSVELEVAK